MGQADFAFLDADAGGVEDGLIRVGAHVVMVAVVFGGAGSTGIEEGAGGKKGFTTIHGEAPG